MEKVIGMIIDMRVAIDVTTMPAFSVDQPIRKNMKTKRKPIITVIGNHDASIILVGSKDKG